MSSENKPNNLKYFPTVNEALAYFIDYNGVSKKNLAEEINVHLSQLSKWITGVNTPSHESKKKLETALGIKFVKMSGEWTFINPLLGFKALIPDTYTYPTHAEKNVVVEDHSNEYSLADRSQRSAKRISEARDRAGYSHEDLAEKLGVHRTTIGKWESNKAQPSIENYEKMSEILKVSPIWLMSIDQYTSQIPNEHALSRRNITDLRTRLAQIQAHAGLPEHDFEILHAAIGLLGRLLRNIEE